MVSDSHGTHLPAAYLSAGTSSFSDFLATAAPGLLPGAGDSGGPAAAALAAALPHGTTIVAASCARRRGHGGRPPGNRRQHDSQRDIEKVLRSDEFSCVGIAGVAGIGIDLIRLFQVELEHYEKLEGRSLSLEGKANRLASMVRGNLGAAMQGLVVVPLFAGFDEDTGTGRIFSYDPTGGRYEEHRFHAIGSGSVFARGSLKKLYARRHVGGRHDACLHAGALRRGRRRLGHRRARCRPGASTRSIATVTADGFRRLSDAESGEYARAVIDARMRAPDGPPAALRQATRPNG